MLKCLKEITKSIGVRDDVCSKYTVLIIKIDSIEDVDTLFSLSEIDKNGIYSMIQKHFASYGKKSIGLKVMVTEQNDILFTFDNIEVFNSNKYVVLPFLNVFTEYHKGVDGKQTSSTHLN